MRATAADVRRAIRMRRALRAARVVVVVAAWLAVCLGLAWVCVKLLGRLG